jgi:hypothetical protein
VRNLDNNNNNSQVLRYQSASVTAQWPITKLANNNNNNNNNNNKSRITLV